MVSRFDVSLNNVSMLGIAPEAIIVDVEYAPAEIEDTAFDKGYASGEWLTRRRFRPSHVTVYFDLSIYHINTRQAVFDRIVGWAMGGGVLRVNDREEQRLNVNVSASPVFGSALRWTDRLSIQFKADAQPFWESEKEDTLTITNTGEFSLRGNVWYAPVSATITPGAKLTNFTLVCGNTAVELTGLNVAKGKSVLIGYDSNGFLYIKDSDGTSLMLNRTGSDELLLPCGKKTAVSITANTGVTCELKARGLWL